MDLVLNDAELFPQVSDKCAFLETVYSWSFRASRSLLLLLLQVPCFATEGNGVEMGGVDEVIVVEG